MVWEWILWQFSFWIHAKINYNFYYNKMLWLVRFAFTLVSSVRLETDLDPRFQVVSAPEFDW